MLGKSSYPKIIKKKITISKKVPAGHFLSYIEFKEYDKCNYWTTDRWQNYCEQYGNYTSIPVIV